MRANIRVRDKCLLVRGNKETTPPMPAKFSNFGIRILVRGNTTIMENTPSENASTENAPVENAEENNADVPIIIYNEINQEIPPEVAAMVASSASSTDTVDDDNGCSICFEPYTTTGPHRMTCLRCGHLFGKRCIERWFQQTVGSRSKNILGYCPTCKQKATRNDIRDHYCRGIKVLDTSEKDEAIKERDREREERKKLQIELATVRQQGETEVRRLQEELRQLQQQVMAPRVDGTTASTSNSLFSGDQISIPNQRTHPTSAIQRLRLEPMQKIEVCKEGESRVIDYSSSLAMIVASSKTTAHLFPGYGLTKVHTSLLRCTKFIRVHSQAIRDVKFTPSNDALILTASLDKSLKVTSVHNDNLVHSWNVNQPVWSCCWKPAETHYIFAGTHNGKVKIYDTRMPVLSLSQHDDATSTSAPLDTIDCGNKGIISLQWVDMVSNANSRGLLVSMIDRLLFLEHISPVEFRPHVLAVENKITSTSYHTPTQHFLSSYGPSARRERAEHVLNELCYRNVSPDVTKVEPHYSCNPIRSFHGGQQQLYMCRNALFSHPDSQRDALMTVVFDELTDRLQLWDATSGQHVCDAPKSFGTLDKMLHLAHYNFDSYQAIAALGTKSLYIYKLASE